MAPNLSQNAPRLFPSALHPNRDGFKIWLYYKCLAELACAAVEAGSTAVETHKDTRRRRGTAK